jgi:5'-nucleotidase
VARFALTRFAAALAAAAVLSGIPVAAGRAAGDLGQREEPGSPRARTPVTFLQINDVYSTIPVDGAGGLARVATIKQRLREAGRTPFLILAGDFLSPSVASSVFKGEQMVAALNAAGLDMATLGNHEFDFGDDVLIERMKQATWQWVVSNVVDRRTGKPIGGAEPFVIRSFGTLKVGFIGLCLTTSEISDDKLSHTRLLDPVATAGRYIPILQRQGAQVIVAVTHLAFADDRRLIERFPQIDLVIGGHEHFPITAIEEQAFISKAGSDARYVARIDVGRRPSGTVERFFEMIPVTADLPDEPRTAEVVKTYEARLGKELDVVVGETTVPLDAGSVRLRATEEPIGNLFADALRAETGADIALINSGSIRGDRVYPAGPLTRRTILAMHPFGNVITVVEVTGTVLLEALNAGVSKLPSSAGQFPQVSGVSFSVDAFGTPGNRVSDVAVNGRPLSADKRYTLAVPDYVLKGGDGYTMLAGQHVVMTPEQGVLLVTALEKYLTAKKSVSPKVEGRIAITQ